MRFIGDIHGNPNVYAKAIWDCHESIQVGDMGLGFNETLDSKFIEIFHDNKAHKFIRGNHDDPELCRAQPTYLGDMTYDADNRMMMVGGAFSIDKEYRVEGISYWSDEELSYVDLEHAIEMYEENKPLIMVTHDAPRYATEQMFRNGFNIPASRTQVAFNTMFLQTGWTPKLWIFGHWHESKTVMIDDTLFCCIGEHSYYDIDIPEFIEDMTNERISG